MYFRHQAGPGSETIPASIHASQHSPDIDELAAAKRYDVVHTCSLELAIHGFDSLLGALAAVLINLSVLARNEWGGGGVEASSERIPVP